MIGTKSGKLMKISIGEREKTKKIHFDRFLTGLEEYCRLKNSYL
jgi:hypothetical protein